MSTAALLTPSGQHAIITPQADGSDRPLVRAASILAALTGIALTAYLLVIAAHDVPFVIRARLATLTAVLVVLTGATLITLVALRVQRRQRADDLAALRTHLDWQKDELKEQIKEHTEHSRAVLDQLGRIEAALPERLGERLEAVEQTAADTATAERIIARAQNGHADVHQLRPPGSR